MQQQEQNLKTKVPIFIGTQDQNMIESIDELVKTKSNESFEFELAIMSPDIFNKSCELYALNLMSEEQRQDTLLKQRDEKLKQQALDTAVAVEGILKPLGIKDFNEILLKDTLNKNSKIQLSNKKSQEMIQFMLLYGFCELLYDKGGRHMWRYAITIDDKSRKSIVNKRIKFLEQNIKQIQNEISKLNKELTFKDAVKITKKNKKVVNVNTHPANVEGSKEFNEANKQQLQEDGELNHPTDYLNDRNVATINGEHEQGTVVTATKA